MTELSALDSVHMAGGWTLQSSVGAHDTPRLLHMHSLQSRWWLQVLLHVCLTGSRSSKAQVC